MNKLHTIVTKNDNDNRRIGYQLPEIDQNGNLTGRTTNVGEFLPIAQYFIKNHGKGDWKHWPQSDTYIYNELMICGLLQFSKLPGPNKLERLGLIEDICQYLGANAEQVAQDPNLPI
jgi:hypothetical protein